MKSVAVCVGLAFALTCGVAQTALAQDGLDVTMRVLDDVKDVDAVILAIEESKAARDGKHRDSEHRDNPSADEHEAERDGHGDLDEGDTDHGDGKYEDHDVPSDVVGQ